MVNLPKEFSSVHEKLDFLFDHVFKDEIKAQQEQADVAAPPVDNAADYAEFNEWKANQKAPEKSDVTFVTPSPVEENKS